MVSRIQDSVSRKFSVGKLIKNSTGEQVVTKGRGCLLSVVFHDLCV